MRSHCLYNLSYQLKIRWLKDASGRMSHSRCTHKHDLLLLLLPGNLNGNFLNSVPFLVSSNYNKLIFLFLSLCKGECLNMEHYCSFLVFLDVMVAEE